MHLHKAWFLLTTLMLTSVTHAQSPAGKVLEIERGSAWVSPYWGYSAPKLVFDGATYYTPLLWGETPEAAVWSLAMTRDGKWTESAKTSGIYQPAILLLDSAKRLIVIYNQQEKPVIVLRSKSPGNIDAFDTLPPPSDMQNAYYIGACIHRDTVSLAYVSIPSYTMFLSELNLMTMTWSEQRLLAEGQHVVKPNVAWTYPILEPDENALHIVASNAPDGGDGNTYNEVWYTIVSQMPDIPIKRELVEDGPLGHLTYATDMAIDPNRGIHVVYMAGMRKYGEEPLKVETGLYHAWKANNAAAWRKERVGPVCVGAFFRSGNTFGLVIQEDGGLSWLNWNDSTNHFDPPAALVLPDQAPARPYFMDILRTSSGSDTSRGLALVTSGVLSDLDGQSNMLSIWSFLPN